MSVPFDLSTGLVLVRGEVFGPTGSVDVDLAVDTGATDTVIDEQLLILVGYDPAAVSSRQSVVMGSGVVSVPQLPVSKFSALGQDRVNFPIIAHTLPPSAGMDGVLGLDFFRDQILTLDFQKGEITLNPGQTP